MSSNRLIYDDCACKLKTTDSKEPGNYRFYLGNFRNDDIQTKFTDVLPENRVEVENVLLNLDIKTSKCPENKWNHNHDKKKAERKYKPTISNEITEKRTRVCQ